MNRRITGRDWLALMLAGVAVGVSSHSAAGQDAQSSIIPPLPATLAGFSDEGVFYLYKNQERVATMEFTWKKDGTLINSTTLTTDGQSVTRRVEIRPAPDGRWRSIVTDSPLGPITLERDQGIAQRIIKDKVDTIEMKPGTVLYENLTPALLSHAVMRYDGSRGGTQTLPLFIIPSAVMSVALTRNDTVQRQIAGEPRQFTRYTYGLLGVDLTVWVDQQGRTCLAEVPAQQAAYVRKGYEALWQPPTTTQASASQRAGPAESRPAPGQ